MSFFKKEKKKEEDKTQTEGIKKEYNVILKEKITKGTTRTVRTFDAGRWKDQKDGVIYLKSIENQKTPINFLEIFPGDIKNFIKFKKEKDTALAALNLLIGNYDLGTAVIASKEAGEMYLLKTLKELKEYHTLFYFVKPAQ